MGWRDVVNRGLKGTTGYRLEKARPPAPKRPKPPAFPRYYDDEARAVIRAVRPWTMTSNEKLFALVVAVRYVVDHAIPGDIVECGVWRGGSMQAIALVLAARRATDRELHLFDTFEGMPPPTEEDVRPGGPSAAELLRTRPMGAHPARPVVMGLGYDFQIVEACPAEPHDQVIDGVVTDARVIRGGQPERETGRDGGAGSP